MADGEQRPQCSIRDRQDIILRQAVPGDARPLNHYIRHTFATAHHLITREDEFKMGLLRQRRWIARKKAHPLETCLLAIGDDGIIGMLDSWCDARARVRHVTSFAMSVAEGHRRRGIGRSLLREFCAWVHNHDTLEKIELHVHSDNTAAIALYTDLGFTVEGRRARAVRYEDGREITDHLMALWPGEDKRWMDLTDI